LIRVGPAGWSYPDWEGRVYPRRRPRSFHPLRFLADFVDCVEVNSTFYAMPRAEHAARWCELVADRENFRFVVKLLGTFTHAPAPEDANAWERDAAAFRAGIEPLARARRLAGILVQFPVGFIHGEGAVRRLGRIHALFEDAFPRRDVPLVLELRHASWFEPPALDVVRGLSFSLAHVDLPPAWNHPPEWHEPIGRLGYLRLHGRNAATWFDRDAGRDDRYDWLYSKADMERLAAKARRIAHATADTYVITNNHFAGKAFANALDLAFLLGGEPVPAPAEIVASYPHLSGHTKVVGQRGLFE
jgi:uncharacterized protein YecE (DUF72 family)